MKLTLLVWGEIYKTLSDNHINLCKIPVLHNPHSGFSDQQLQGYSKVGVAVKIHWLLRMKDKHSLVYLWQGLKKKKKWSEGSDLKNSDWNRQPETQVCVWDCECVCTQTILEKNS